jgi:hypothetical protein
MEGWGRLRRAKASAAASRELRVLHFVLVIAYSSFFLYV